MMRIYCKKGFTLLEVVVIVSLLAILLSVAVPSAAPLENWKLQTAAQELAAHLREARQDAIASGQPSEILFLVYENCYLLRLHTGSQRVDLPAGIEYEGTTTFPGMPPRVSFNYLGRPSRGGTVILESAAGENRYVIMTPVTGRVRLSREPPDYW